MTRTVLLADDSVTIQKVVELTFIEEDLDVVAVGTGDEALARLQTLEPALVIADVHMPGADGFEVCRKVKKWHPSVPVLLLVGTFEPFDVDAVAAVGAEGHLKKPFDSQELLRIALGLIDAAESEAEDSTAVELFETAEAAEAPAQVEADAEAEAEVDSGVEAETAAPAAEAEGEVSMQGSETAEASTNGQLGEEDVERIARRVVELLSDKAVREVAWEVVPDLAELLIRDRLRELESQVD